MVREKQKEKGKGKGKGKGKKSTHHFENQDNYH